MQAVRIHKVERGTIGLWWLGQNGYLLKTPDGAIVSVDAYLTNYCQETDGVKNGINLNRKVPVFVAPEDLDVDYFLCTHSHDDHADPATIKRLRPERIAEFIGPGLVTEKFARCGVPADKIKHIYTGAQMRLADFTINGTFALPTDDTDLNHMGFLFAFDDGPRIYITGDTDYSDLLGHVGKLQPDVMITCINGGFNNLSHWEAAEVARMVKPRMAIPCHYDMFPDNAADPQQFRASLHLVAPDVKYEQLEHAVAFIVAG